MHHSHHKATLYMFLQSKLDELDPTLLQWLQARTVKALLRVCVELAQEIVRILSNLLEQRILRRRRLSNLELSWILTVVPLETLLPVDMGAASISTISLLLAAATDQSLLWDHSPWSRRAYAPLEDMSFRGNLSAGLIVSELRQLDDELSQLTIQDYGKSAT